MITRYFISAVVKKQVHLKTTLYWVKELQNSDQLWYKADKCINTFAENTGEKPKVRRPAVIVVLSSLVEEAGSAF